MLWAHIMTESSTDLHTTRGLRAPMSDLKMWNVFAGLALLSGCAATAPLPPPTQIPAADGWTRVVQEPLFAIELPGKPQAWVQRQGFLGQVEGHGFMAATGNMVTGIAFMAPWAGWNEPPERVRDALCTKVAQGQGIHLVSERRPANETYCTGLLRLDAHNELHDAPAPMRARFLGVVLRDVAGLAISITPVEPTPQELAIEERFFRSIDDSPGRKAQLAK